MIGQQNKEKIEVVYWEGIRGRMTAIRYLISHAKADVKQSYIPFEKDELWKKQKTMHAKKNALINLPYLHLENGETISQTGAVMNYLGRKYGYTPRTEREQIAFDMLEVLSDELYWE